MRAAASGHSVKWFRFCKKPCRDGEGFRQIEIVDNYKDHLKWARSGLIFVTGNAKYIPEMDRLRDFGFPVFAPSVQSARLEIDRGFGMQTLEKLGIEVPHYETFTSLQDAEKFARKADQGYVFKCMGSEEDKSLTYISGDQAELVGWIQRKIKMGVKLKGPCMLQEKIDMLCDFGVSGWFGPEGFLKDKWQVCWEHKKLMNNEIGPNTGEQGCYSFDSEVLTSDGWKFWPDVTEQDELATLVDGELTFETPSAVVRYEIDGPMVQWTNRSVDVLVTPNHNMYVARQFTARFDEDPKFEFLQASECTQSQYLLKRTSGWKGHSPETFVLNGNSWDNGVCIRTTPDLIIPFSQWCKFLGIWFAEGSTGAGRRVNVAQSHPIKAGKVEEIIKATGLPYMRRDCGFDMGCAQLARVLKPFGRSYEKRVPQYVMSADPKDISEFLDGFVIGDGHIQKNGSRFFYTSNPGLADDLQELMLRCGRLGVIKKLKRKTKFGMIDGREIIQRRQAYVVYERAVKTSGWLDLRDRKEVNYTGKVYCATVSSHILYVRRNGKPMWCGNTVTQYVEKEKLADEMLLPLEPILKKLGHRGDFAVGVGIDKKGRAWPFEFTARIGCPTIFVQMASHFGDPVKWCKDLLDGKDSLKVSYDAAIGVVCAQPQYPYDDEPSPLTEGNVISGIDDVHDQIHLVSAMREKGPVMKDNKVIDEEIYKTTGAYVLVATGLGKSIESARQQVYGAIDKIVLKDLMYRTDIGSKIEKVLPDLNKFGYATQTKFS